MKIVVFDLDETLGYFTQFGIFWDCLSKYIKTQNKPDLNQSEFDIILNLYPEFLRPNIINILTYLKKKKQSKCCHKMMIYTNNTGTHEWTNHIVKYFEKKIKYKLIDQIIGAFKINGTRFELCRTTYTKTHDDFIKCTKLPLNAEICFIDDVYHPKMVHDNIYYINIKPYYHDLTVDELLHRFMTSEIGKSIIDGDTGFEQIMTASIKVFNFLVVDKDAKEQAVDNILGKHIMAHLHHFFNQSSKNKTQKMNPKKMNKNYTFKNKQMN